MHDIMEDFEPTKKRNSETKFN